MKDTGKGFQLFMMASRNTPDGHQGADKGGQDVRKASQMTSDMSTSTTRPCP